MSFARELLTHVLVMTLVINQLFALVRGVAHRGRIKLLVTQPERRLRLYYAIIVQGWVTAAFVPLIAWTSVDVSAQDLGWAWPQGEGLDYALTVYWLAILGIGAIRTRRRLLRGDPVLARAGTAPLVPQTVRERWWAVGLSLTVGVTEEMVFRGLLIAVGTRVYHLPLAAAALISLALFVGVHTYQGALSTAGVVVLGAAFTSIYLVSGSLLLAIALHVFQDLAALLFVPANPREQQAGSVSQSGDA